MKILVINAGSSSVKFSVFDMESDRQVFKAGIERFRDGQATLVYRLGDKQGRQEETLQVVNIDEALSQIPAILKKQDIVPDAVGHRVAHGGSHFQEPAPIDDKVVAAIESCTSLAPLHNPPNLRGVEIARKTWPDIPQIAVFDTAFHQTIPQRAYTYAVPEEWRETGVRRYGFHGTSHKYVALRAAEALETPLQDLRIISCHLGNGASVCAIDRGFSVDTSMGMTALEGLVMGSRSGDVDPGLFSFLHRKMGLSVEEIEDALYRKSGLAALSGVGNDMRDIEERAATGDKKAQLAINVYAYRVRKYIGAYAAAMGGFDVLAFTGGIGENSASMRKRVCDRFEFLGLYFDEDANAELNLADYSAPQIQQPNSKVRVMVTQTREQWMIARETSRIISSAQQSADTQEQPDIPVAVSAHHVHLTQKTVEELFGPGHQLEKLKDLSQPGGWAAKETVAVIGPKGEIDNVRVLGPCREANQIELSRTETFKIGVDAPVRLSGHTDNTPIVTLRSSKGKMIKTGGAIVAHRHIHMSAADAARYGHQHGDVVDVDIGPKERGVVFKDVIIRVGPDYATEMHIDTDEANAARIPHGSKGELMATDCMAHISCCKSMSLDSKTHQENKEKCA